MRQGYPLSKYLVLDLLVLAPGGHDERVVDADASDVVHAQRLKARELLEEAGQVGLGAAGRERTGCTARWNWLKCSTASIVSLGEVRCKRIPPRGKRWPTRSRDEATVDDIPGWLVGYFVGSREVIEEVTVKVAQITIGTKAHQPTDQRSKIKEICRICTTSPRNSSENRPHSR